MQNPRTKIAKDIIDLSIKEILIGYRFLSMPLSMFTNEFSDEVSSIGTNGKVVFINPDDLIKNYRTSRFIINKTYLHMMFHCLLKHPFQVNKKDPQLWDLATDIAVSFAIDGLKSNIIIKDNDAMRTKIKIEIQSKVKYLTAQHIYEHLKEVDEKNVILYSRLFIVDNHSYWYHKGEGELRKSNDSHNNKKQNEGSENKISQDSSNEVANKIQSENESDCDSNNETSGTSSEGFKESSDTWGDSNIENSVVSSDSSLESDANRLDSNDLSSAWSDINTSVQLELEMLSKQKGTEFGNSLAILKLENITRYDYSNFLKKFSVLREEIKMDLDTFDYVFYTYGLKLYKNVPLIEPLEYTESFKIYDFVIVIDTSGSVWGEDVKKFLRKTYSILKSRESFHKKMNVHIIQSDKKVQDVVIIKSEEEFKAYFENFTVKGGGGTDFRPAIHYVNRLVEEKRFANLKGMIYFTDGFGDYPEKRPNYDVAFVFLADVYSNIQVPSWAMKIVLESDDIS